MRANIVTGLLVLVVGGFAGQYAPSSASAACLLAGSAPAGRAPHALRFGITPQLAGNVIPAEAPVRAEDDAKALHALRLLRVKHRDLVLRLNRMFWSDGASGIARYAALVDHYAAAGFKTELQVRYHPPAGHEGDLEGWVDYVRKATHTFARRKSVVELSITNEVNLPLSANTSDGAYKGAIDAIIRGVVAARREADRHHRSDLKIGFTFAYRYLPGNDDQFWKDIGAKATPQFRAALDHVGLQLYPGVFIPPVTLDAPGDVVDAVNLLRTCWMPLAGLGRGTSIWITENGYPTTPGTHSEEEQLGALDATVHALAAVSGTYGVTDYRYFNLRDNDSAGTGMFDTDGLLRDDYSRKPSYFAYRTLINRYGTSL